MYALAIETFSRNSFLFFMAALTLAAVDAIGLDTGIGVTLVAYGMMALFSHRMVLLGETYSWVSSPKRAAGERLPFLAFLWRYMLFFVLFTGLFMIVMLPTLPDANASGTRFLGSVLTALVIVAPVMAVVLALFGTVLPAAAVKGDLSFTRAYERGRARFTTTVIRLAIGPGTMTVVNLGIATLLSMFVNSAITGFMVTFAVCFVSFIPTHLTAVALSLAYSEAEAMDA